jgi:hypothetical protein
LKLRRFHRDALEDIFNATFSICMRLQPQLPHSASCQKEVTRSSGDAGQGVFPAPCPATAEFRSHESAIVCLLSAQEFLHTPPRSTQFVEKYPATGQPSPLKEMHRLAGLSDYASQNDSK